MKATELRIGNIVKYKEHFIQIENLVKDEFWFINSGESKGVVIHLSDIEPIPLTPAVLDKIKYLPYPIKIIGTHRVGIEILGCRLPACYEYLHQLQNLVFALTGEELEINLEEK